MSVAGRHAVACVWFLLSLLIGGCDSDDAEPVVQQSSAEPPPLQLILVGGQSNAGLGGSDPTRESRPLFPNVRQFAGGAKAGLGWELQPEQAFAALEPAYDDMLGGGQYIATMAGLAMGQDGDEYIVRTDWFGGRPIEYFVKGTIHYRNTLQAARSAKSLAGAEPIVCPWYVWIQGESGPADRTIYARQLREYITSIVPEIAGALGQTVAPTFVIVQTNNGDVRGDGSANHDYRSGDSVGLAQWDVAQSTPRVILAGPTYQAPIIPDVMDNIHLNSIGRMVVGEMLAAVKAAGPNWKPLQPEFARLLGNTITIRFNVPAGPLAWDTTWIAPAPHFGFSYFDDDGSAEISDVRIISRDTVRIVLSNVPTGKNRVIRYAQEAADYQVDGWSAARGQLMSPTQRVSLFWSLGHPVPRTINHYSVKFEMPVTRIR
jgi:hypothetical protein